MRQELRGIFGSLLGLPPDTLAADTSFLELGADSLLLMRASHAIADRLGVKVPFRDLLGRYATIEAIAGFVGERGGVAPPPPVRSAPPDPAPADAPPGDPAPAKPVRPETPTGNGRPADQPAPVAESAAALGQMPAPAAQPGPAADSAVHAILRMQLEVMLRQLDILQREARRPAGGEPIQPAPPIAAPPVKPVDPLPVAAVDAWDGARQPYIPYRPISPHEASDLSVRQREHLARLVTDLSSRTAGSKQLAMQHRPRHADSRMSAGFQVAWKELVYPIVADQAEGSRFVDVDGNEFVDITMDYGVNLFGHNAPFIAEAIARQLERGFPVGPYSALSGPLAEQLCDLTGNDRAAFTNSGTEAVMVAMRLARTVTRRPKVAVFSGCFHGTFDGVLARSSSDPSAPPGLAVPIAPGVLPSMLQDVVVAEYGDDRAFEVLEHHADDLAAILVEPVQSRRPNLQPGPWLGKLREFATRIGTVLIFDEIITGLRLHPGGAQAWFGVRADIATYGKVLGGGMPIGAIAGSADVMAAVDGGPWQYGDASWPSAETTLFAGTFWKHPLVMAAANAVLGRLHRDGPELQQRLNAQTAGLVGQLNTHFEAEHIPIRVVSFGSLFRFDFGAGMTYRELFFHNLLARGVYVWEGRTCYLSTAHTDEDISRVVAAVQDTVQAMRTDGLIRVGQRVAEESYADHR